MRVGMDQTTAWIVSVVVSASLFGAGALVVSGMADRSEHEGEFESFHGETLNTDSSEAVLRADGAEHGEEGHEPAAHGEAGGHATDEHQGGHGEQSEHGESADHGEQGGHGEGEQHPAAGHH